MTHKLPTPEPCSHPKAVADSSSSPDASLSGSGCCPVQRSPIQAAVALSDAERQEFLDLRREVKALRLEREILRKAAAFFAAQSRSNEKSTSSE